MDRPRREATSEAYAAQLTSCFGPATLRSDLARTEQLAASFCWPGRMATGEAYAERSVLLLEDCGSAREALLQTSFRELRG